MQKNVLLALLIPFLSYLACHRSVHPTVLYDPAKIPQAPDYARLDVWAAHPDKNDPADQTPCPDIKDEQAGSAADVFFLYPTTYTGDIKSQCDWNCPVEDVPTNKKTDESSILFQASLFNGAGRVFSPRYRQAHLHTFFAQDKKSAQQALDLAYVDIKASFDYYLKHWNNGRPFIIAGHSQGARHAMYLIRDMVENTLLEKQLVAAYIVGWPVKEAFFKQTKACQSPDETGCFCSWRTWEREFGLAKLVSKDDVVCTNPLTWTTTEGQYAPRTANLGGVVRPYCAVYPQLTDAEVHNGFLLCTKPKFPGSRFYRAKNYHPGDFNLYYMNVRANAQARVKSYLKK